MPTHAFGLQFTDYCVIHACCRKVGGFPSQIENRGPIAYPLLRRLDARCVINYQSVFCCRTFAASC